MTVCAPASIWELKQMLELSLKNDRPMAIKYPKKLPAGEITVFSIGEWEEKRAGTDVCLIAYGRMVSIALETANALQENGVSAGVANARFLKPIDETMLSRILNSYPLIYTLEDTVLAGSLGEEIATRSEGKTKVVVKCVPDRFIPSGTISQQLDFCGLDRDTIVKEILLDNGKGKSDAES